MSAPSQTEHIVVVASLEAFIDSKGESEQAMVARYLREAAGAAGAAKAMLEEARRLVDDGL